MLLSFIILQNIKCVFLRFRKCVHPKLSSLLVYSLGTDPPRGAHMSIWSDSQFATRCLYVSFEFDILSEKFVFIGSERLPGNKSGVGGGRGRRGRNDNEVTCERLRCR
jgi:hypothetical protein